MPWTEPEKKTSGLVVSCASVAWLVRWAKYLRGVVISVIGDVDIFVFRMEKKRKTRKGRENVNDKRD